MRINRKTGLIFAVVFAAVIAVCAAVWIFFLNFGFETPTAYVYSNDVLIRVIPLDNAHDCEFVVECDNGYNLIKVEGGKISVIDADCPDKTCVHTGWIENGLVPIACIPHKLLIRIENADGVAAIAG